MQKHDKIWPALVGSLLLHVIVVGLIGFWSWRKPEVPTSHPVKITIVHKKREPLVPEQRPIERMPKTVSPTTKLKSSQSPRQSERKKSISIQGASSYRRLLPDGQIPEQTTSIAEGNFVNGVLFRAGDPENQSISSEQKNRNISELQGFGTALAEQLSVPTAVRTIVPNGDSFVRLTKKNNQWTVSAVDGDPFYRAILHEIINNMSPRNIALIKLAATDYESVRVHWTFSTMNSNAIATRPPKIVKVEGNRIDIDIVLREDPAPEWVMTTVSPAGPTVNLLGIGIYAAGKMMEKDPWEDPEVKKLRLSPAFSRTIP